MVRPANSTVRPCSRPPATRRQVRPHVEHRLQAQPDAPEHRHVQADARASRCRPPARRRQQADDPEGDDRQDDVAAVDPVHLPVQPRQRAKSSRQLSRTGTRADATSSRPGRAGQRRSGRPGLRPSDGPDGLQERQDHRRRTARWNRQPAGRGQGAVNEPPADPRPSPPAPASRSASMPRPWTVKKRSGRRSRRRPGRRSPGRGPAR